MLESLVHTIVGLIETWGYPGIVLFMALESMFFPVPSEAVMPPAGMLVKSGHYTWTGVAVASTIGTLLGSYASYLLGRYAGRPAVVRWGRWALLDEAHLAWAERFYARFGPVTVFICRFIPAVRHISSIPAGIASMPPGRFLLLTGLGGAAWNMFLAWVGYRLGDMELISRWSHRLSTPVTVVLALFLLYYLVKIFKAVRGGTLSR